MPDRNIDERTKQFKQIMEMPVAFWPEIRLKAEVGHGRNWADAKAA